MNIEKIRKQITGGCRPFILRTSDGREYRVPHPEFIALGRTDIAVVDKDGDINVLDALPVVAIKTLKAKHGVPRKR